MFDRYVQVLNENTTKPLKKHCIGSASSAFCATELFKDAPPVADRKCAHLCRLSGVTAKEEWGGRFV